MVKIIDKGYKHQNIDLKSIELGEEITINFKYSLMEREGQYGKFYTGTCSYGNSIVSILMKDRDYERLKIATQNNYLGKDIVVFKAPLRTNRGDILVIDFKVKKEDKQIVLNPIKADLNVPDSLSREEIIRTQEEVGTLVSKLNKVLDELKKIPAIHKRCLEEFDFFFKLLKANEKKFEFMIDECEARAAWEALRK